MKIVAGAGCPRHSGWDARATFRRHEASGPKGPFTLPLPAGGAVRQSLVSRCDPGNPRQQHGIGGDIQVEIHHTVQQNRGQRPGTRHGKIPLARVAGDNGPPERGPRDAERQPGGNQGTHHAEFRQQLQVIVVREIVCDQNSGDLELPESGLIGAQPAPEKRISFD